MRKCMFFTITLFLLLFAKVKAQTVKWLTVYNNKFVNKTLFANKTIYAKDYKNGEGLILYLRNDTDTLSYTQTNKEFQEVCATYLQWHADKITIGNSTIILQDEIKKGWVNYFPDHCSHMSHYSHYSGK